MNENPILYAIARQITHEAGTAWTDPRNGRRHPAPKRTKRFTTRAVKKAIGNPHLNLYEGNGYWYFVYDNGKVYEDRSVSVYRLNSVPLKQWIKEGREFVAEVEKEASK